MSTRSKKDQQDLVAVTEEKAANNSESNVQKVEKMIYIGPNLAQLTKYTVLTGGIPKHVEALVQKCEAVSKLIVPVTKLVELEKKANQKGTLEHRFVQEVLYFLSEKGKGDK